MIESCIYFESQPFERMCYKTRNLFSLWCRDNAAFRGNDICNIVRKIKVDQSSGVDQGLSILGFGLAKI